MAYFDIPHSPGRRIHFEVYENLLPTTTLFLHGNLASNRWWKPVLEILQQQKQADKSGSLRGSVILAEFRGCGQSTAPATLAEVSMELFAKDFIALARHLKLSTVNVVGHSTGGLIAAIMAALAPEVVNKVLLLDPVGARGVKFDNAMTGAFEAMKADRNLTATIIGSTILNNDPESSFFQNEIVEDAFLAVKNVGAWVLQALDGLDVRNLIRESPTFSKANRALVLFGEEDVLLSRADAQELAQLMSGEFKLLEKCGHCGNVENPQLFVKTLQEFLFSKS